jgi:uncharacterized protein (DUF2267 family)
MAELRFVDKVAERAQVPEDRAAALTEATLRTLAARLSAGEAADLANRVPEQLRPLLIKIQEDAEPFSFDEFVDRVAAAAAVPGDVAKRAVGAVLQAMRATVGQREFEEFMAQLPKEFGQVVSAVPRAAA